MANHFTNDNVDIEVVTENITFIDSCFNNSFTLQLYNEDLITNDGDELNSSTTKQKLNKLLPVSCDKIESNNGLGFHSPKLNLKLMKYWGLPSKIVYQYEKKGIVEMFDWQVECLGNSKVLLDYSNLVYSAPTSAGKTLIAEILSIKTVLERQKKVIIILPFVSVVREKMSYLQDILSSSGIRVEGFMGSQAPSGGFQAVHIAICTIEKANSLVNKLMDEDNIADLGAVIVDEMHLLGDPSRGYILELLLTKIKYISKAKSIQIQIVAMSATFPNIEMLAKWLDAELYVTQFRPIPLEEFCLVSNNLFNKEGECVNTINKSLDLMTENSTLLHICLETIKDSCSVLIFCMTKNWCENLAQLIASSFCKIGFTGIEFSTILRTQLKTEIILEVLEQLKNCPVGLDEVLKKTVSFGVAYHHAGLTYDERDIIESGFKSGAIRVLVATSTLSSGVNLPARKVIIRTPIFQKQVLNILTYKQMVGRAGRMGKDKKGESILFCSETEKNIAFALMTGKLDPVRSCLESGDRYLRAVLEAIASGVANTTSELAVYEKCTLNFHENYLSNEQQSLLDETLDQLKCLELVRVQNDGISKHFIATALGKACLSSSMAPHDGLSLFCELQKARRCLVLETDLHLIYLVTPYSISNHWGDIDWLHLFNLWESLTSDMKRVGHLVGVQENFIIRCMRTTSLGGQKQHEILIHKRFYTALALQDLINEMPLSDVANKFRRPRGFLQSLQQSAATFAGMVTAFCHQLGWKNMEMLMSQFQDRLHFGIHLELLALMKLSSLNGLRARSLFDAGFETISDIATAAVNAIENALYSAVPFQTEKDIQGDDFSDMKKKNKLKNIWITGFCGMTVRQAAETLILEARKYLEREIGVSEIHWNKEINDVTKNYMQIESEFSDKKIPVNSTKMETKVSNVQNPKEEKSNSTQLKFDNNIVNKIPKFLKEVANVHIDKDKICIETDTKNQLNGFEKMYGPVKTIPDSTSEILNNSNSNKTSFNLDVKRNSEIVNDISNDSLFNESTWNPLETSKDLLLIESIDDKKVKNNPSANDQPSISFEDVKNKTKICKKLSSSFSGNDHNSSLFEESLPFDLLPSRLFEHNIKNSTPNNSFNILNPNNAIDIKIGTLSLANVFNDSFGKIEDNDLKLVYDDKPNVSNYSLFQENSFLIPDKGNNCDSSNKEDQQESRDVKWNTKHIKLDCKPNASFRFHKNIEKSRFITFQINNTPLKYIVLSDNDFNTHEVIISSFKEVSIYLTIEKNNNRSDNLIGYQFLKERMAVPQKRNNTYQTFVGVAVYGGQGYCIFYDITTSNSLLTCLMNWMENYTATLKLYSAKYNYINLKRYLGLRGFPSLFDVSLFEWLIDNEEKETPLNNLIKKYCDFDVQKVTKKDKDSEFSFSKFVESACIKAWAIWQISEKQKNYFQHMWDNLQKVIAVETQIIKILCQSEDYGLSIDKDLASQMLIDVKESQNILQAKAFKLCGHTFNLNSSKDVAKVVGIYNKGRKVSTKKTVLSTRNSLMAKIIIYWRKLNAILTKTLYPLTAKASVCDENDRIHPKYLTHTCTGRICMNEPNLQSVPRTFSIPVALLYIADANENPSDDVVEFNCRNIFKASSGHVLVSADYCQIEMRILTHFCEDDTLIGIMKSNTDVFTSIAASWGCVSADEVDDELRQRAKQLCYGIIYGMGSKALSQQLDVCEVEAAVVMDTFHGTYPAIKVYTQRVIDECKEKGYVETLMKRRRYLPDINSKVVLRRCAAERQAVNTTIQGSAADIVKNAMCDIARKVEDSAQCEAHLVLQMHDELIYEVSEASVNSFMEILKKTMENTMVLNVPLPVKIKYGYTWGSMRNLK